MRIGIDLGGSKIEGLAIDEAGHELVRRRVATPSHSCAAIVEAIAVLVAGIEKTLGKEGSLGIGTPGAMSPASGLMRNSNTLCLNDQPLDRLLAEACQREVRLANDANCFALSEAVDGAGRRARVVFGVIIGTGTGGGIVIDKSVLHGANAIAGEWGHNPLPWPSEDELPPECYCGKRGCIETWISGTGMARDHATRHGGNAGAREIAAAAGQGNDAARDTIRRYQRRLAKALATVINVLDPDVVVLGGGVSNIDALYDHLPLADYVFSDTVRTEVVRNQHGDASGVRGAAWLWS